MGCSKTLCDIIPKIIGMLFIVLFVYAATSKLLALEQFEIQLGKSPFISAYAKRMVWMIPITELSIVVLFLFEKYLIVGFYSSFILMTLFTIYIFLVLNFSDSIPCACGGILQVLNWKEHLIFNIVFIALALLGILLIKKSKKHLLNKNTAQ